jgi:hypothetical protein
MRRDLQAMERVLAAGIHSQGECPGASARGCYAAKSSKGTKELMMEDRYVELESVDGHHVADLLKSYLESHGIAVEISQESYGSTMGITVAPLGVARILVPESCFKEAQRLLDEFYTGNQDS